MLNDALLANVVVLILANKSCLFAKINTTTFDSMLNDALLANVVVLILANKQDLPKAASPSALTDQLRLREFKQQWKVQGCCGTSGDGLYAGLDWLADNMPTTTSGGESAKSK